MAPMKSPARRPAADAGQDTYSLPQLARRWEVSQRAVRQLLQQGFLPFVQIEGRLRVPVTAAEKFKSALRERRPGDLSKGPLGNPRTKQLR